MLYPTTTIDPLDRDPDGMYPIAAGCQYAFPFQVPVVGTLEIGLRHNFPNSQDWSISVSCADELDTPVSLTSNGVSEFNLDRSEVFLTLYPLGTAPEGGVEFDPARTYYLYVLNMQSRPNGFLLTFNVKIS
jgi:hypothetical protein